MTNNTPAAISRRTSHKPTEPYLWLQIIEFYKDLCYIHLQLESSTHMPMLGGTKLSSIQSIQSSKTNDKSNKKHNDNDNDIQYLYIYIYLYYVSIIYIYSLYSMLSQSDWEKKILQKCTHYLLPILPVVKWRSGWMWLGDSHGDGVHRQPF